MPSSSYELVDTGKYTGPIVIKDSTIYSDRLRTCQILHNAHGNDSDNHQRIEMYKMPTYPISLITFDKKCPFRHCDVALGSEVVCELWRIGRCFDRNCPFRHMEPNIKRSTTQCWFETQPAGCRKPHCVFLHTKPRPSITDLQNNMSDWILPTAQNQQQQQATTTVDNVTNSNNNITQNSQSANTAVQKSSNINQESQNIVKLPTTEQKLSISIDDKDDESDDNNEIETIVKPNEQLKKQSTIKTLEQIKMEKILHSTHDHLMDTTNNSTKTFKNTANINKVDMKFDTNLKPIQSLPQTSSQSSLAKQRTILPAKQQQQQKQEENHQSAVKKESKPIKIIVKTLEQIRKEREESAATNNVSSSKENQQPNTLKRTSLSDGNNSNDDTTLQRKPIKIRRNRLTAPTTNLQLMNQNSNSSFEDNNNNDNNIDSSVVDSQKQQQQEQQQQPQQVKSTHSIDNDLLDDELDLEFLQNNNDDNDNINLMSTTTNTGITMMNNDSIDDDELMREIDQVINS